MMETQTRSVVVL